MTSDGLKVLGAFNLISVIWNQDSNDWAVYQDAAKSAAAVKAVSTNWLPTLKTGSILGLEHDLFPGEVSIGLQIGQIAVNSGAVISPVATCLHDSNWYSTFVPSNPNPVVAPGTSVSVGSPAATDVATPPTKIGNTQSSTESIAILTLLFASLLSLLALF